MHNRLQDGDGCGICKYNLRVPCITELNVGVWWFEKFTTKYHLHRLSNGGFS